MQRGGTPINRLSCIVAAAFLVACAVEDPAPIFVDVDYQIRCLGCEPRAADDPAHGVLAVNGQNGYRASCTSDRWQDRTLFSVSLDTAAPQINGNNGFALELSQLIVGSDPGSSCRVLAREGVNAYEGRCSADAPSADIPCQLTTRAERGVLFGSVLCDNMPNRSNGALRRSLVAPASREPAEFEVHGCPGL